MSVVNEQLQWKWLYEIALVRPKQGTKRSSDFQESRKELQLRQENRATLFSLPSAKENKNWLSGAEPVVFLAADLIASSGTS